MSSDKFEYRVLAKDEIQSIFNTSFEPEVEYNLDKYGANGWQIVHLDSSTDSMILMRKKS